MTNTSRKSVFSAKSGDFKAGQEESDVLLKRTQKYWDVSAHCETLLFPLPRPEILFDNPAANYYYQRLSASGVPDQELAKLVTKAHLGVLARLNQSKLQVKNFIFPVQLMKMKYMDPLSRQRVIEELSKYFSFQKELRNVVLEQAEVKFIDLCCLLVAIAGNSRISTLFLWHVLDSCDKPFEGPLKGDIVLDDLPRIPYTYNPGGRKYLRDLEIEKSHNQQHRNSFEGSTAGSRRSETILVEKTLTLKSVQSLWTHKISLDSNISGSKDLLTQIGKVESMVLKCLTSSSDDLTCKRLKKEFAPNFEKDDHVYSQAEAGIQCTISQDHEQASDIKREIVYTNRTNAIESKSRINTIASETASTETETEIILKNTRLRCCEDYLKCYKNTEINTEILQDIYMIALNGLTNLTQLAVNYCMLADGTGNALLSMGCIAKGKLRHLKLLCEPDDIPSPIQLYDDDKALHAIPDLIWHKVKKDCPQLKVHIICVSMSSYDVTKRFVTRSMPLSSFQMEDGFCATITRPQLMIFCTLKCLWLNYVETLEHVNLTLWHSSDRIDSSLVKLIQETQLCRFEYHGPLQYKSSINKLCDAALLSPKMKNFKLMIQADPCYPHIIQELSSNLNNQYRHKFQDKSIHFMLGTFNS